MFKSEKHPFYKIALKIKIVKIAPLTANNKNRVQKLDCVLAVLNICSYFGFINQFFQKTFKI